MEALGEGGSIAEDAAAEPASDARRTIAVHALSAVRRELHGGGAGSGPAVTAVGGEVCGGFAPLVRPC